MNDALEVLNELEKLLDTLDVVDGLECISQLENFITYQRSIYQPAYGECAAWVEQAKRIAELEAVIVMQRETIHTLNSCIGGEGSLTTDNLVTIGRLESKLAIAIEALEWINKSESGVAELAEALTKIKGE